MEQVENTNGIAVKPVNSAHSVMAAIFDLDTVEDVTTAEVRLKRNGQPLPIIVHFAGPEHPKRKAYALRKSRRVRAALAKTGKMELGDPVEDELDENDHIADCVLGWRTEVKDPETGEKSSVDGIVFAGVNYAPTVANILRLFNDPKRAWFRKSMQEAFNDGEAFIKTSDSD